MKSRTINTTFFFLLTGNMLLTKVNQDCEKFTYIDAAKAYIGVMVSGYRLEK